MEWDLLDVLVHGSPDSVQDAYRRVRLTLGRGDRSAIRRTEERVYADPTAITFDEQGFASVAVGDDEYAGGRFSTPTIQDLRPPQGAGGPVRLWALDRGGPLTDIGALQAFSSRDTVFQVASQFNCLEAPGPFLVAVQDYLHDPTQGPRAAVSAFPAALVRHYAAPGTDGERFRQTPDRQLNLLADALPDTLAASVRNGYLQTANITDLRTAADALGSQQEMIRVGVSQDAQVVLGADHDGSVPGRPLITQVFTSTLAAGGYGQPDADPAGVEAICRPLLRASYLGTLLSALTLGKSRVVLTLIGGGVFANPHSLIVDSLAWAMTEVDGLGALDVVVNARSLEAGPARRHLGELCREHDGAIVTVPEMTRSAVTGG
ncbi:MAG: hypothetical protein ACK5MT_01745 [Actinomycetales bacterium]